MTTLQKTNKYYICAAIAAFALSVVLVGTSFWEFFIYSVLQFIGFALILWYASCQSEDFFTKKNLVLLTTACLIVGVMSDLMLSQKVNGNLFVFSEGDALGYYELGVWLRELPLSFTFGYLYEAYPYDDWGATFMIPMVLRLIPNKIFLNVIYVSLGIISAVLVYDTGKKIMNQRYAFFASLSFSISSFMIFVYSSALKEPFMIFLSVAAFACYYNYLQERKVKSLVFSILWAALMVFFRPAVTLFMVVSIGLSLLISLDSSSVKHYIAAALLGIGAIAFSDSLGGIWNRYIGEDSEAYYNRLDYMSSESMGVSGSMLVSAVATLIGPFPAMLPKIGEAGVSYISLYGPGLLYRLMLALPFWIGAWVCLTKKVTKVLPLLLFPVLEMASLALILEGLELRINLAHMPMVFLFAFWCLYIIDSEQWSPPSWVTTLFNFWPAVVAALAILWNFR